MSDKEQFEQDWDQATLAQIQENETYKQILKDSFGGVMYNVANRDKYDTKTLIGMWESLSPARRESACGIMKGAFNFLMEVA